MKIILSRKGFDSGYGGYPSPIFSNGRMVSLPIPYNDLVKYSELRFDRNRTYYDLMKELNPKIKYGKKWHELSMNTTCHLDPDLDKNIMPRNINWKPCFGQNIQSQSHLANEGVKEGDLFLFFGWFRDVVKKNGVLQFDRYNLAPNLHVIFGYLQIGETIQINETTQVPECIKHHPHVTNIDRRKSPTNTVYIARDTLTWDKGKPGAGLFNYDKKLVLTKKGLSRSKWGLPAFFKGAKISRHSRDSWKNGGYFQSVAIGQEFVIEDNAEVENWARTLISKRDTLF